MDSAQLLLELTREAIDFSFYKRLFQVRDAFQIGTRTLESEWPHVWFKTRNPKTKEISWVEIIRVWHNKKNHDIKIFLDKLNVFLIFNLGDPEFTDKYTNGVRFLCHRFVAGDLHTYEVPTHDEKGLMTAKGGARLGR